MNRYRLHATTTGEFDLIVAVKLLDQNSEDIDTVYEAETEQEAVEWVVQQGGTVVSAHCPRCGHSQFAIWSACENCGNPALTAGDAPVSRKAASYADVRTAIAAVRTSRDRNLDFRIDYMFATGLHEDEMEHNHDLARDLTSNLSQTLRFFAERLPNWAIEINTSAEQIAGRDPSPAGATITPPGNWHHSQDPVADMGGYVGTGYTAELAVLDAIFQKLIADEA